MPRRQATRVAQAATTDEPEETPNPLDEVWQKIASIEETTKQQFEEIDQELNDLKTGSNKIREHDCHHDENFLKLCHAVDYLLEHTEHDYDTMACREMMVSLLGQKTSRPFSGRTIRNRILCKRIKRWCVFIVLILFAMVCMTLYGLHRDWCFLLFIACISGTIISSIGIRRIYKIIEAIW